MVVRLGQHNNVGEKPTFILYTYINRHTGTPNKNKIQTMWCIIKQGINNIRGTIIVPSNHATNYRGLNSLNTKNIMIL